MNATKLQLASVHLKSNTQIKLSAISIAKILFICKGKWIGIAGSRISIEN